MFTWILLELNKIDDLKNLLNWIIFRVRSNYLYSMTSWILLSYTILEL